MALFHRDEQRAWNFHRWELDAAGRQKKEMSRPSGVREEVERAWQQKVSQSFAVESVEVEEMSTRRERKEI